MKICVTAGASGLDAPMDPRFGRCPFFVVVDLDSMSEDSIPNSNATASSGAGIQAAQEIAKQGVSALITGNIGPNAMQTLSAAKIDVYQHQSGGSVRDVVKKFQQGELIGVLPNVSEHMGGKGLPTETIFAEGVQVMIVGGLGPKAVSAFNQAGVDVFVGAVGTVKDAVDNWRAEILTRADLDNACQDHRH